MIIHTREESSSIGLSVLRIIRRHHVRNMVYYSDCYYDLYRPGWYSFYGGILYGVLNGILVEHFILFNRHHASHEVSWSDCIDQWGRIFSTEFFFALEDIVKKEHLLAGRQCDDWLEFDALFPKPIVSTIRNIERFRRSILSESDICRIYMAFLMCNGGLFIQKSFSDIDHDTLPKIAVNQINTLFKKCVRLFSPIGTEEELQNIPVHNWCDVTLYVADGRYVTLEVLFYDKVFMIAQDYVDIKPLLLNTVPYLIGSVDMA